MCEIIEQYARDEAREATEKFEKEKNNMLNLILNQIRKGALSINDASIELGIPKKDLELML